MKAEEEWCPRFILGNSNLKFSKAGYPLHTQHLANFVKTRVTTLGKLTLKQTTTTKIHQHSFLHLCLQCKYIRCIVKGMHHILRKNKQTNNNKNNNKKQTNNNKMGGVLTFMSCHRICTPPNVDTILPS